MLYNEEISKRDKGRTYACPLRGESASVHSEPWNIQVSAS